jgi:hypothetical protein
MNEREVERVSAFRKLDEYLRLRAAEDDAFRQALLEDPKGTIKDDVGVEIPDDVQVEIFEDTPTRFHLVLPVPLGASDELPHQDLDAVAGGMAPPKQQKTSLRSTAPRRNALIAANIRM